MSGIACRIAVTAVSDTDRAADTGHISGGDKGGGVRLAAAIGLQVGEAAVAGLDVADIKPARHFAETEAQCRGFTGLEAGFVAADGEFRSLGVAADFEQVAGGAGFADGVGVASGQHAEAGGQAVLCGIRGEAGGVDFAAGIGLEAVQLSALGLNVADVKSLRDIIRLVGTDVI